MCRVAMNLRVASKAFMEVWATLTKYGSKDQTEEEQKECSRVAFDLQYFKAQHNKLSIRVIQITMKVPEHRSLEELELLLIALRSLLSFRQYSKSYQLLLAKIMRYERFRRRRVITKKGHCANSFYFIYSGGVSFTSDEDGSSAFENEHQADLRKGARFGEIPVLKALRRNFTAVCMEETELLVVDKEDFFSNRLDQVLVEESHQRFIFFRSLNLLESLPDSSIAVLSDHAKTEEFLYGQVIPNCMDHLIFVTKGRFVILRLVDLTLCHSYHKFIAQELPFMKSTLKTMESIDTFQVDKRLLDLTSRRSSNPRQTNVTDTPTKPKDKLRSVTRFSGRRYTVSSTKDMATLSPTSSTPRVVISSSASQLEKTRTEKRRLIKLSSAKNSSGMENIPLSKRKSTKKPTFIRQSVIPKALAVAVYMKIDSVLPEEVFGLWQYFVPNNLKDRRPLSIKSQGTKIVRIDMKTFDEIADHQTLQKVRKLKSVYPSDDQLCEYFIRNNFWKIFKKNMVAELTSKSHRHSTHQGEAMYEIDKTGILNLPEIASNPSLVYSKPTYYVTPLTSAKEDHGTTSSKRNLQLIHGMAKFPSSINYLLY
uniref:cyclic nucleotide-binding domain-containing protein 2-like n=1 Tax=Pristiophorus japonicus TaxID=55135 RepID=UPI00398F828A